MEAKTKKALIIVTSLLVIGGVVGGILWKRKSDKKKAEAEKERLRLEQEDSERNKNTSGGGSTNSSSSSSVPGAPTEKTTIKEFQEYAKSRGANLGTSGPNKDGVDGSWGGKSQSSWNLYGSDFLKLADVAGESAAKMSENYKEAKEAMGSRAKDYVTYATLTSEAKDYGLTAGGGKIYLVTKQDGLWQLYWMAPGSKFENKELVAKGRYYQGGKRLTIGVGKNKGVIIKALSYGKALAKAIKS